MKIETFPFYLLLFFLFFSCNSLKDSRSLIAKEAKLILVSDQFSFTEGPSSDKNGNVYFTDQPNNKIYFWNWKTNQVSEFLNKSGRANGTFVSKNGTLLTCSDENGEIWEISPEGKVRIIQKNINNKRMNGPNDLWEDQLGGIYFTDPLYVRDYWKNFKQEISNESLYYRNSEGKITKIDDFQQPNGIIGSQKLKKLYVSDISAGKTYVYDIISNGTIENRKLFCEMGSDGMTLDEHGNLYLTGDGVIVFISKGEKIQHISVPEKWTANVTFGGKNNNTLFITASKSVYTLKMNVKGVK